MYHRERRDSSIRLNRVGHQWYWSYSYSPFQKEFDSFLGRGTYRLLESDNKVVLPFSSRVRVGIRREDVIHSWSLPLLNIKVDGNPGRINRTTFSYPYPGLLYGQCREICGANHSFMPIEVEFTSTSSFLQWLTI